ncbi:MAG: hypothetical protein J6X55_13115 [Victivallales bacterium]|nr:hypothetical protein [Victivallales bacterium]
MSDNKGINSTCGDEIKAVLLHLGHNMWCDYLPEDMDNALLANGAPAGKGVPATVLSNKDDLWNRAIDRMVERKLNMLVIDIGEGLVLPSHPELAIEGSWTPEKMQAEIKRLKALGIEAIPKLNFSTTHNGWLKHYRRMVSTTEYYRVCEDVIRDTGEVFGTPRFFHIGYDEESAEHQSNSGYVRFICVRKGELWKHDFLHIVGAVEKNGMRAWAWSDYGWEHPDFYEWAPKSILMSNWYYDECYEGFELSENKGPDHKRLKAFYDLEKAGFEQVPCGTNWSGWSRRKVNAGADDVIGRLVAMCRRDLNPALLKGFMMAPWAFCDTEEHLAFINRGTDLFAEALKQQ